MAGIDPRLVMVLYRRSGMPVMDCKAALIEAAGDMAAAIEVLRRRCKPISVYVAASPGFWEQFRHVPLPESSDAAQVVAGDRGPQPS